jgi:membrane fusion protein
MAVSASTPLLRSAESPSTALQTSLFRQEVIEFQRNEREFGRVVLLQPISLKLITWMIAAFVIVAIILLVLGQYSRKATVSGYLLPASGTAKIFSLQRGTITKVHVSAGQEVQEHQALLTIDTTQISATGEDVNAVILASLTNQREQLNGRIADEQQRMGSERERLGLLIEGLKTEIAQLEAQIPLQEDRIKLAEGLVSSIAQLVARGAVTDVEFKRRQSEALDQKQNLNSLKQQLAARRNQLTDTQYSLSQLPMVTAEKIQSLQNELSTLDQRAAEITGREAFVIRAPVAGRVTALQASVGKMAELNQLQLEIVPPNSTLNAELFVPSRAIGFVRVGQRVNIRYDAFPYQHFGRHGGTIVEISQNILTGSDVSSTPIALQEPAYRVTVRLDRQDIDAYGKTIALQPGMLFQADVNLDRRRLMSWLLDPLLSAKR